MPLTRITLVFLLSLTVPLAAAERAILVHASFANANAKKERDPAPKRSRLIEPDFAALETPALRKNERKKIEKALTAALFDDTVFHLELTDVERNAADVTVWYGAIEGEELSSVTIAVKEKAMVASISTPTRRYMIEPIETGAHEAFELDLNAFPDETDPLQTITAESVIGSVTANDSAAFVDILVVYTDDLRASLGSTAAAQSAATSAIAAANTAYQNSGVTFRLRLAGTAEVAYNDSGSLNTALSELRNGADGVIDEVHALRNQYGADDVAMLVLNSGGSCGIAYVGSASASFASSAFAVIPNSCAVGNLSFPHELGHNFGLAHDRLAATGGANPAYPYGYGYVDTGDQFRDIMAYANDCGSCPRIQYFSNPNLTFLGRPLGISYESSPSTSADAVRALNEIASVAANWRQSVVVSTPPSATFTDDPLVAGTTRVKAQHITELRTAINNYRSFAGLTAYSWTTSVAAGAVIGAAQVAELRTALTPALTALSRTATYTDTLAGGVRIKAIHLQELRNYLK
jgi:hypothetical protein